MIQLKSYAFSNYGPMHKTCFRFQEWCEDQCEDRLDVFEIK